MPQAIPVILAAAGGAAAGAAGGFTLFTIAGSAALAGAVTFGGLALAQVLLTPRPKSFDIGSLRGDTRSTIRAAVSAARWVIGRARIGSVLTYLLEPGENDREVYMVLTICEGPIEGIERIWINGVEIPWSDGVTDHQAGDTGNIIKEHAYVISSGDYDGALFMRFFYNGAERLDSFFPGNFSDNQWTAEHKLAGKAVALMQLYQPDYGQNSNKRVWSRLPNFEFLVKGQKISYPGVNVPTWTENAAAIRYWFLTKRRGVPSNAIHPIDFAHAFEVCGEEVDAALPQNYIDAGYDNKSPRYSINGLIYANDDHENIEAEMDFAWAGYAMEVNGIYRFRPGVDRPATIIIDAGDIIARGNDKAAPSLSDRVNSGFMRIAQSRSHDFTQLALPEFRDDQAIIQDGRKLPKDFQTRPFICCPVVGGRLLAIMLRRARANKTYQRRITPGANFDNLRLIPTDRITLDDPEYGLDNVPVVINSRTINDDWSIDISFEEAPDNIYESTQVLPPLFPDRYNAINFLGGPPIPSNVLITADAILTDDGSVHSIISISWDNSPHRTRIIVEWVNITGAGRTFNFEMVINGSTIDVQVPYEGVYRVALWHVNPNNVLSLPYVQEILIDWSSLDLIPLEQRVNDFIDNNPSFQALNEEAVRANAAGDRAAEAALRSEDAARAAEGSSTASAGSATLSEEDAEASSTSSLASSRFATAAAAEASNAALSASAASQDALSASASVNTAGAKASAASVDAASASTSAGSALAASTRAAASEQNAGTSSAAARVSQIASAGSADRAASVEAGLDAKVATGVDEQLRTTFAAAVVLRARAGTANAQLELVALSNPSGPRSQARIRADMFRVGDEFSVDANGNLVARNIRADHISGDVRNWRRLTKNRNSPTGRGTRHDRNWTVSEGGVYTSFSAFAVEFSYSHSGHTIRDYAIIGTGGSSGTVGVPKPTVSASTQVVIQIRRGTGLRDAQVKFDGSSSSRINFLDIWGINDGTSIGGGIVPPPPPLVSNPLSLPDPSNFNAPQGVTTSRTLPAASGGSGNYTYSASNIESSTGATFNASNRMLSVRPTTGSGTDSITYTVNDGSNSVSQVFIITRTAAATPVPGVTTVNAEAGSARSVASGRGVVLLGSAAVVNGVGATTYSWRRISGVGGSLNNSSIAQPTFTAPTLTAGASNRSIVWRLTATNNGVSDTDDVRITVNAPVVSSVPETFDVSWQSSMARSGGILTMTANSPAIPAANFENGVASFITTVSLQNSNKRVTVTIGSGHDFAPDVESNFILSFSYAGSTLTFRRNADLSEPYSWIDDTDWGRIVSGAQTQFNCTLRIRWSS